MFFTSSKSICKVSVILLVRSWKRLKSFAIDHGRGITASSEEKEELLVCGVTSSSSLTSCSSRFSSGGSEALETVAEGECLAIPQCVILDAWEHGAYRLPTVPNRATEVVEKAWVAERMVGHIRGVEVQI